MKEGRRLGDLKMRDVDNDMNVREQRTITRGGAGLCMRAEHCDGCGETTSLDLDHVQEGKSALSVDNGKYRDAEYGVRYIVFLAYKTWCISINARSEGIESREPLSNRIAKATG